MALRSQIEVVLVPQKKLDVLRRYRDEWIEIVVVMSGTQGGKSVDCLYPFAVYHLRNDYAELP